MNRTLLSLSILMSLLLGTLGGCSKDEQSAVKAAHEADSSVTAAEAEQNEHRSEAGDEHDENAEEARDEGENQADSDEHGDEHGHEEGELDFARIDPNRASEHGIEVATAAPGVVAQSIALTGRLIIDPRRVALVRARFAGPVKRIAKDVGESVRQGEPLAQVESNESLTVYDVPSPVSGIVLERMTNVGDVADSEPLFRVGDVASLQAELKVFPKELHRIERGADAIVRVAGDEVRGKVVSIVPEVDTRTQATLVRVSLTTDKRLKAAPGQFVTGRVLYGRGEAAVAVPVDAVQRTQGREVIFVPEQEGFRARTVTTGRRDNERIEILEGLRAGESYVAAGAFLVKAEIGKSLAEHED